MLSKPVTDITRNSDGTISFMFMKGAVRQLDTPVFGTPTVHNPTTFTATWTHENAPEEVSYTLEVTPHMDVQEILCTTFGRELEGGWELLDETFFAGWDATYDCFKIGTSKRQGGILSPSFLTGCENVISVVTEAASYGSDNSTLVLKTIGKDGQTLAEKSQELGTSFGVYTFVLDCLPEETTRLEISTAKAKNRALIRYANIYSGDASSMFDGTTVRIRRADSDNEADKITVSGITATSYTFDNLNPGERYDYRIKAIAGNTDEYADSEWSPRKTVDLSSTGIDNVVSGSETGTVFPAEYFTLDGIRVDAASLTPGVYVVREGTRVRKVVVR